MVLRVVEVLMVHSPPSSVISQTAIKALFALLFCGEHTWCRHGGGLSEEEVDIQLLEHLLVLVCRGPLVLALESVHCVVSYI